MSVLPKKNGELIFLHKVLPGAADESYGIHVAKLAGLPQPVLAEATTMLHQLEQDQHSASTKNTEQLALFDSEDTISDVEKDVISTIRSLYLADKTPLELMNTVSQWQQELNNED